MGHIWKQGWIPGGFCSFSCMKCHAVKDQTPHSSSFAVIPILWTIIGAGGKPKWPHCFHFWVFNMRDLLRIWFSCHECPMLSEPAGKQQGCPNLSWHNRKKNIHGQTLNQRDSYLLDLMCISFSGMTLSFGLKRLSGREKIKLVLEGSAFTEIPIVIFHRAQICHFWLKFWRLKARSKSPNLPHRLLQAVAPWLPPQRVRNLPWYSYFWFNLHQFCRAVDNYLSFRRRKITLLLPDQVWRDPCSSQWAFPWIQENNFWSEQKLVVLRGRWF